MKGPDPVDIRALQSYAALLPEPGPGGRQMVFLVMECHIDQILAAIDHGWVRFKLLDEDGGEGTGTIVTGSGAFELSDGDNRYAWAGVAELDAKQE